MKFLVLGCNGMAGHLIALYLTEQGHKVLGFARRKSPYVDSVVGDARDANCVQSLVSSGKYDVVVNCIGILNQYAESMRADAIFLNSYLPHYLAEITRETSTQVIHLSTDCVFSGAKGQYNEDDFPDGTSFYDRSKALGELNDNKNLTLRTSIIGPDINPNGMGLLHWFSRQNGPLKGYTKAIWTGQTTLQLAKTIEAAAKASATGLVNMVPDNSITKFELLQLFNNYLRGGALTISPTDEVNLDKSLRRTNNAFPYRIPGYNQMMAELKHWILSHSDMYPGYIQ